MVSSFALGSRLTSSDTCSEGVSTTGNCSEMRCFCGNVPLFLKSEGFIPSMPSLAFLCTQKAWSANVSKITRLKLGLMALAWAVDIN